MNPAIASGDDVEPPATLGSICCPAWFPLSSASVPDTRFNAPVPLRNPRQRFFPVTTDEEWNDWRWQMRHRIRTVGDLEGILRLTPREREAFDRRGEGLPVAVTPFYMSLIDPTDPADPLRRAVVPSGLELVRSEGPSLISEDSPSRMAPTLSSSRFRARPVTPWGNSSSSLYFTPDSPWI